MKESYSSIPDTMRHIEKVSYFLDLIATELIKRSAFHDHSKLQEPELSIFNEYTPKLKDSTYGSDEYKQYLKEMKVALDHHYSHNPHHPEFFEIGMHGMTLIDLVEMFCDWLAATKRHDNGNIFSSIRINKERFNYPDMIENIFFNTARDFFNESE